MGCVAAVSLLLCRYYKPRDSLVTEIDLKISINHRLFALLLFTSNAFILLAALLDRAALGVT
jgi:hypothetical protein